MKVLVTGFEPFNGETINPSFEAIKMLPDEVEGAKIIKAKLPTVFRKSLCELEELISKENPDIVICVGQAAGRSKISIERVAINIDDAEINDNEGNKPKDEKIFVDGENAYFSNLPIKLMVKTIKEHNIPAEISNSAGTYVCNHVFYGLMYLIDKKFKNLKGGFIHVPFSHNQVLEKKNVPSMSLEDITNGLFYAIKGVLSEK
ncbi:pyrrolidone-carboxylate peptidase [Thermosipho melanesiensis]|uniref:Pyrrolidone-carboxylate peptidase n=2 Tax=Thermosipho melanesiensis TaxID=46541 RepID=PCP_THEM4|nr:pyroglutamyl-peptidase I [Thermosipho melanesiensis]A6LL24.1 RecName: Full=Pyrrolidone-carboxylate peptidase; AltName: Full=5-oxoprolyl-peptidase; AltName: Full=Pyroglutamyl-peptidase I; Short=PGP-I; Short=Pyrase [Thermosipho melanesiensis BI429]ABR30625.1 pyrrolidone-carboxylate peptidase [Thermosipho melanesiensis BI429]APT73765.1 pyrrolidone-carboxylate peptidase [Thermosipho melanesiensis]OOC35705.1 pyrrolidone-carboxylate peptidase [Thermosipho melanesiensis]OOC39004.1 pyrrolidone-carb